MVISNRLAIKIIQVVIKQVQQQVSHKRTPKKGSQDLHMALQHRLLKALHKMGSIHH
jgi:hypothetical protein